MPLSFPPFLPAPPHFHSPRSPSIPPHDSDTFHFPFRSTSTTWSKEQRPSGTRSSSRHRLRRRRKQSVVVDMDLDVVVVVHSDCEESDGSDWSVGWFEPHAAGFCSSDDEDESEKSFAVLVPCYGAMDEPQRNSLEKIGKGVGGKSSSSQGKGANGGRSESQLWASVLSTIAKDTGKVLTMSRGAGTLRALRLIRKAIFWETQQDHIRISRSPFGLACSS